MWVIMDRLMSSLLTMWQAGTVPKRRSYSGYLAPDTARCKANILEQAYM